MSRITQVFYPMTEVTQQQQQLSNESQQDCKEKENKAKKKKDEHQELYPVQLHALYRVLTAQECQVEWDK